jgi:phage-related protein
LTRKTLKSLAFVGSARRDIREFPDEVRQDIGYALFEVQKGGKPASEKPLKGFGSVCPALFPKKIKAWH